MHPASEPHFVGANGRRYSFAVIAACIDLLHPDLNGSHIFAQLDALDLRTQFDGGLTPYGLPYSFTDYLEVAHAN